MARKYRHDLFDQRLGTGFNLGYGPAFGSGQLDIEFKPIFVADRAPLAVGAVAFFFEAFIAFMMAKPFFMDC